MDPQLKSSWQEKTNPTPQAAPFKGAANAYMNFAGNLAKGSGAVQEINAAGDLRRLAAQAAFNAEPGEEPTPPAPLPSAAIRTGILQNPQYQAGQVVQEAAPQLTPAEQKSNWTKLGGMVGGAAPMALGPAAIPAFSLEAVGRSIGDDYDKIKAANPGISENEASEMALDRAVSKGAITAGVFAVVPKAMRGPLENYLVAKFGPTGFAQWLGGRAAASTEGAAVMGAQDVGEKVVDQEVPDANTLKQMAAGALMNLLLPWRRGDVQPEGTSVPATAPARPPTPAAQPSLASRPPVPTFVEDALRAAREAQAPSGAATAPATAVSQESLNELMAQMQANQIRSRENEPVQQSVGAADAIVNPADQQSASPVAPATGAQPEHAAVPAVAGSAEGPTAQPGPGPGTEAGDVENVSQGPAQTYLIRHGTTDLNRESGGPDRIRGWMDVPLNDEGRRAADQLGEQLADKGITTLVTSDLSRAEDTARAIANKTGAKIVIDPDLRPWHVGEMTGNKSDEMAAQLRYFAEHPDERPPGGETFDEFKKRVLDAYGRIQQAYEDQNVGIVTHFRVTRLIEAWRAAGSRGYEIDPQVFNQKEGMRPTGFDVIGKEGNAAPEAPQPGRGAVQPTPTEATVPQSGLTSKPEGVTTETAAPETQTGGTALTGTQAEKAAPPVAEATGTIPVEGVQPRSAAASRTRLPTDESSLRSLKTQLEGRLDEIREQQQKLLKGTEFEGQTPWGSIAQTLDLLTDVNTRLADLETTRRSAFERWADETLERIKKEGRQNVGIDPEWLAAAAVKGAYVIARIARQTAVDFTSWSSMMINEFGQAVIPHLKEVWRASLGLRQKQLMDELAKAPVGSDERKGLDREQKDLQRELGRLPQKPQTPETPPPSSQAPVENAPPRANAEGISDRQRVTDAKARLEEVSKRIGDLGRQINKDPAGDTKEARSEQSALQREAKAIQRELDRNPEHVADLLRRMNQHLEEAERARQAGNGAGRQQSLEEARGIMEGDLANVPKKLLTQVYNDLVSRGEIPGQKMPEAPPEEPRQGKAPTETPAPKAQPQPKYQPTAADRAATLGEELPEQFKQLLNQAKVAFNRLTALGARSKNKDIVAYTKDAADNTGAIFGKQGSNTILHGLNRAFGATDLKGINERNELREAGLSAALEAGAGLERPPADPRQRLQEMRDTVAGSQYAGSLWGKRELRAIDFALRHFDRLEPIAQAYAKLTEWQRRSEEAQGYGTLYRDGGYVFHMQDLNSNFDFESVAGKRDAAGGAPTPFKHVRDHPTYADSIAAGVAPKTLSAVDLLQRRLTLGRRMVNYGTWMESMRGIIDPKTQQPLVTDAIVRLRADGSKDVTAPVGYFLSDFGGRKVAVHSGYSGLFNALTEGSALWQNAFSQTALRTLALGKQFTLLGDTFHAGRLAFWNAITRLGAPTYRRGQTLLDNSPGELRRMAQAGEIPADWVRQLEQDKARMDLMLKAGMNVGSVSDALHHEFVQSLPVLGTFNKWLFGQYQRGAMTEAALIEFDRAKGMEPNLSDEQVARQVAKAINTRFGNLQSQGLFKSKTFQDLARVFFLAPQWNESLIRAELGAVRDAVSAPVQSWRAGHPVLGAMARGIAVAAVGQFLMNQMINYLTRGKPTWENEEGADSGAWGWAGARISAYIPDALGGPGFFLNPTAVPMEITHLLLKSTERNGGNFMEALRQFAAGRLNNVTRPIYTFITHEDMLGRRLRTGTDVARTMAEEATPVPISSGALYRMVKQLATGEHEEAFPGQFEKQVLQSAGVRAESVPGPEQRMGAMARDFNREHGVLPSAEYYAGDYQPLVNALRLHNQAAAQAAMEDLLARKTPAQVGRHFSTWPLYPFTGQSRREAQFFQGLNPEEQQAYQTARQQRADVARNALEMLSRAQVAAQ